MTTAKNKRNLFLQYGLGLFLGSIGLSTLLLTSLNTGPSSKMLALTFVFLLLVFPMLIMALALIGIGIHKS